MEKSVRSSNSIMFPRSMWRAKPTTEQTQSLRSKRRNGCNPPSLVLVLPLAIIFFSIERNNQPTMYACASQKSVFTTRDRFVVMHTFTWVNNTRERKRERERAGVGYVLGFGAPFEAKRRERNFSVFEVLSFIENSAPNKERFTPPFSETQFNNLVNDLMKMITF